MAANTQRIAVRLMLGVVKAVAGALIILAGLWTGFCISYVIW